MAMALMLVLSGCSSGKDAASGADSAKPKDRKLTLVAYSIPGEAYKEIIPAFQAQWKEKTGGTVTFTESYGGSGSQGPRRDRWPRGGRRPPCVMLGKPLVTAAILRYSGQITVVLPGETACYRCLFPEPPPAGSVPSCSQAGILGPVAGVMGSLQALEAIKLLLGSTDSVAGRFIAIDLLMLETQVMDLHRSTECAVCGDEPTITVLEQAEEFCSL